MVPSAAPATRRILSGPPCLEHASPRTDPAVPGNTHIAQTASLWPSNVALASTLPLSQTLTLASCPPEKIHPSPMDLPPFEKFGVAGQAANEHTAPTCPLCVKYAGWSRSLACTDPVEPKLPYADGIY